ncbi:hypothetical protein [Alteromonas oceanisediminis]|uniref:hypothetical protein n=1 Tax=Alteromonas oceanisediminis TaxID=2836180 RepID=UPI001BDA54A3|nr:hypothetical protein [Alteromonas oceanisediminis]MBT0587504.1 hypothetical protein [Alteromonas oceanisediminis]
MEALSGRDFKLSKYFVVFIFYQRYNADLSGSLYLLKSATIERSEMQVLANAKCPKERERLTLGLCYFASFWTLQSIVKQITDTKSPPIKSQIPSSSLLLYFDAVER